MRRHDLTQLSTRTIDDITSLRIRQYEQHTRIPVSFPVPVENIIEQILGLHFDWIEIDEQPGEQILAGLSPERRTIVLNTRHLELFEKKPGLERSTIGHEAGHWDIDIDRTSLHHPTLPGMESADNLVCRHDSTDELLAELLDRAVTDDRCFQLYRQLTAGQDPPAVKSAVDRYQSSLLMPDWLIREAADSLDFTAWPDLYDLAHTAGVTISNLVVRLHRLDFIFIPRNSKTIYAGRDHFLQQKHLFGQDRESRQML
ncbi:MAG: hypothetical protein NXI04_20925 [Planctomycetaceae bacterium]|nr:hypothetical protein [Planctomycetaceae bacterium]